MVIQIYILGSCSVTKDNENQYANLHHTSHFTQSWQTCNMAPFWHRSIRVHVLL